MDDPASYGMSYGSLSFQPTSSRATASDNYYELYGLIEGDVDFADAQRIDWEVHAGGITGTYSCSGACTVVITDPAINGGLACLL